VKSGIAGTSTRRLKELCDEESGVLKGLGGQGRQTVGDQVTTTRRKLGGRREKTTYEKNT